MTPEFKKNIINIIIITSITKTNAKCTGINFDNKYYELSLLKEDINNITQLNYNKNNNIIYFSYDLLNSYKAFGYIHAQTKEVGTIQGIKDPNSLTIDDRTGETYIGGADGIFILNNLRVPEKLPNIEGKVISVFFKHGLYYINNNEMVLEYVNGMKTKVPELFDYAATNILLDDDRNIFFLQDKKLFRVKIGTRAVNTHERYTIDCMAKDAYDRAYFCTADGIYRYNKYKYTLEKVSSLRAVKGLAFDASNDPVISLNNALYKLNIRSVAC